MAECKTIESHRTPQSRSTSTNERREDFDCAVYMVGHLAKPPAHWQIEVEFQATLKACIHDSSAARTTRQALGHGRADDADRDGAGAAELTTGDRRPTIADNYIAGRRSSVVGLRCLRVGDLGQLAFTQRPAGSTDILGHLLGPPRAHDRRCHGRVAQHPGHRQLADRLAVAVGDWA
jgi:hypothetical protein